MVEHEHILVGWFVKQLQAVVGRVEVAVGLAGLVDQQKLFVHVLDNLVELDPILDQFGYLRKIFLSMIVAAFFESSYVPRKFLH